MQFGGSSATPVTVNMLVGIIHAEGLLYSGALGHELNGATCVARDVANGQ